MTNIASIPPYAVYRCRDGRCYRKVSDMIQVSAHWMGGVWVEDGRTIRINPNELVEVVS